MVRKIHLFVVLLITAALILTEALPGKAFSANRNAGPLNDQVYRWVERNDTFGQRISMVSPTDGWTAVIGPGRTAILNRWNGAGWSPGQTITSALPNIVTIDIEMVSPTDGWLVLGQPIGNTGSSEIYRWNGSTWSLFTNLTDPNMICLGSIDMLSATEGWAAGTSKFGSMFYHWNGTSWTKMMNGQMFLPMNSAYQDIDIISPSDVWAAGDGGEFAHWNGTNWSPQNGPVAQNLRSLDMLSTTDGWAVGDQGTILRWNGSSWSQVTSPVSTNLTAVEMVSAVDGWAAGENGTILHWDGSNWARFASPSSDYLMDLTMLSPTDGWIVMPGGILHYELVDLDKTLYLPCLMNVMNLCGPGRTIFDPANDVSLAHIDVTQLSTTLNGETLQATFYIRDIPSELNFNREGVPLNSGEYTWFVFVDVDDNPQTGGVAGPDHGAEYALMAFRLKDSGAPFTASIAVGVNVVGTWKFDSTTHYWNSFSAATLSVNPDSNTMVITGTIPGIQLSSRLFFITSDYNPGGTLQMDKSSCSR